MQPEKPSAWWRRVRAHNSSRALIGLTCRCTDEFHGYILRSFFSHRVVYSQSQERCKMSRISLHVLHYSARIPAHGEFLKLDSTFSSLCTAMQESVTEQRHRGGHITKVLVLSGQKNTWLAPDCMQLNTCGFASANVQAHVFVRSMRHPKRVVSICYKNDLCKSKRLMKMAEHLQRRCRVLYFCCL